MTQNASVSGAFLVTDYAAHVGSDIELTIILSDKLRLCSSGKITRVAKSYKHEGQGIAVACARPWTQAG